MGRLQGISVTALVTWRRNPLPLLTDKHYTFLRPWLDALVCDRKMPVWCSDTPTIRHPGTTPYLRVVATIRRLAPLRSLRPGHLSSSRYDPTTTPLRRHQHQKTRPVNGGGKDYGHGLMTRHGLGRFGTCHQRSANRGIDVQATLPCWLFV